MSNICTTILRRASSGITAAQIHKPVLATNVTRITSDCLAVDSNIENSSSITKPKMNCRFLSTNAKESVIVSKFESSANEIKHEEGVITSSCGTPPDEDDDDDYTEEMFVQPHFSIGHQFVEWGGPTRGGRLSEPTRFGDWERKGRCTDF
mmetsp:Transcript_2953/g.3256  ORF Transcript_2953/g.3256 Transcript_2953/m.3256 type:complete len:150 (-) Transcript_2953:256-705(-)|eukprot:CAMPEP_0198256952 /NCGR_PEP_ID=MMETSP1447-20131203/6739_1 /TAXON_ID=420782 /ORGANISM="Chaetoceros dichaeta, Strain CCMP1751" /LENGTH=149 /DNA_ID=CAMNT_0043943717 /DNA_START=158 /DNA_END=607 /DNA_ORIENTATION=+